MTVKYNYKCSFCEVTYLEQRPIEQSQLVIACQVCHNGTYEETSFEIISNMVEREASPVVIEKLTEEPTQSIK